MSNRINTNVDAFTAQRNLSMTGLTYSKSVQKLSSGLRINSASDDAAGLNQRKAACPDSRYGPGAAQQPGWHLDDPDW